MNKPSSSYNATYHTYIMLQISMPFPEGGLVYDYCLDDGGVSKIGEEEEEEEKKKAKVAI